jgi:hypothetical protein
MDLPLNWLVSAENKAIESTENSKQKTQQTRERKFST